MRAVVLPYELVKPYSTCVSASSLVVQEIEAEEDVMEPEVILEITGGVVSATDCVVAEAEVDWLEVLPAASYAATVYVYPVDIDSPVSEYELVPEAVSYTHLTLPTKRIV